MQKQKKRSKLRTIHIQSDVAEIFESNAKDRNQTYTNYLQDLIDLDANLGYLSQGTMIDQLFSLLNVIKEGKQKP